MRRRVVAVCLGLLLTAGLCGWLALRPPAVSRALSQAMRRGPGATVDFAEVAPFAWDRVYVFGPYTPHDRIRASLGFRWGGLTGTTVEGNDGVNLVVFVRGAEVVEWFEHPRREELEELATAASGYAREEARFTVCRVGVERRLALAPPKR